MADFAAPTVPPLAFFSHFGRWRKLRRCHAGFTLEPETGRLRDPRPVRNPNRQTQLCALGARGAGEIPTSGTKANCVYFIGRRCKPTLGNDRVRFFGVDAEVLDSFIDHAAFDLAV